MWDAETGVERARLAQIDGEPLVMFSPDGTRLATAAGPQKADPRPSTFSTCGTRRQAISRHRSCTPAISAWRPPSFSPDGRRLATTGPDETVRVWDVQTGAEMMALPEPWGAYSVDFSPDGKRLATGARWEGEIRIWDLETRAEVSRLQDPTSSFVYVVRFSPDGTRLATGGRRVFIWDAETAVQVAELDTVNNVQTLAFNADGSLLTTLSGGVFVSPANARVGKRRRVARSRASRRKST